jgi:hypothetical protein
MAFLSLLGWFCGRVLTTFAVFVGWLSVCFFFPVMFYLVKGHPETRSVGTQTDSVTPGAFSSIPPSSLNG